MEENEVSTQTIREKTDWSFQYISNCRTAKADPMPRLREWADVLGVSIQNLIDRAEEYEPKNGAAA